MSQADEDEAMWLMRYEDIRDDIDCDGTGYATQRQLDEWFEKRRPGRTLRRIAVEIPGTVELSELVVGETFRFPNAWNPTNVYMVIESKDLPEEDVHYVLLNSGRIYNSKPNKRVFQVDARISVDDKATRGRV